MILTAKKLAWEKFLAELNSQTSMSRVWKFFKAMRGTAPSSAIPFSNQNDEPQDAEQCAEMLAQHNKERFTSTTNLSREQLEIIRQATQSPNDSDYNQPFTQHELSGALNVVKCKSSMGGDNFHNDFLTYMPKEIRCHLLHIFNIIYEGNFIPQQWKTADIIPIPKPGKDPADPAAYRPISLLSVVGKLMERLVNNRLKWLLETKNILPSQQFGSRNNRSKLDPLAILEHEIQMCFKKQQTILVAVLDLSQAFDRADILSIIFKIASHGFSGNILR